MRRLDSAYQNFFRRVKAGEDKPGFPHFKGRNFFNSITYTHHGDGIKLTGNRLYVQNVGTIKVKLHRPYKGKIKTASLKLECGKWYLILSCDVAFLTTKSTNPAVGVDVGLESFLTTSDGEQVSNPRFHKKTLPKLRVVQRSVSRKKMRGSNRRKEVKRLQKIHARIRNARRDHHHKTAFDLCRRYGLVAVERLTVKNMVKNHRLSRSIADAGWSAFAAILEHHGQKSGTQVIAVNPSYTSQLCSACGALVEKDLQERWHSCECGCSLHRDVNAARNILARGLARTEPTKRNVDVSSHVSKNLRQKATE